MSRSRLLVGAVLTTLTLLAACGSEGSAQHAAQAWTCAPGVTDDQIRVGILYPDTGAMSAQFAGYRSGVEARIAEQNALGGVGGRRISTIWRDDESTPGVNLQAAKDLVHHGAFAVLEHTSYSQESAPWLAEQGIPVVGVADRPVWANHKNMFTYTTVTDDTDTTTTLGDFVRAQGGTRAAIAFTGFSDSSRLYAENARRSLESAGIRVVFQDRVDAITATAAVDRMIDKNADTLVAATPLNAYTTALVAAAQAGHRFTTAISAISYDVGLLNSAIRMALAGTYSQLPFAALERNLPAHRTFLAAMASHAPEIQPPSRQSAITGWISADLFIRGLKTQQGCPTRESYMRGLRGVTDYDADGFLVQKINFSTDQGQLDRCSDFVRVSAAGDAFEIVIPQPYCGQRIAGSPGMAAVAGTQAAVQ